MIRPRVSDFVLLVGLTAILGWPVLITILEAVGISTVHRSQPMGGGLMDGLVPARGFRDATGPAVATILVVLLSEAIALPIGVILAGILARTDAWGRTSLIALLGALIFLPLPLLAAAWLGGFGNAGRSQFLGDAPILVGVFGASFVHAMASIPWIMLIVGVAASRRSSALEELASIEGPPRWVIARVTLWRSMGPIVGAALLTAALTAGEMTVTDLLQVRTFAEEAYVRYGMGGSPGEVAWAALPPMLAMGLALVLMGLWLARSEPSASVESSESRRVWRLGVLRVPVGLTAGVVVGSVAFVPLASLIWRAGRGADLERAGLPTWSFRRLATTVIDSAVELAPIVAESTVWSALAALVAATLAWLLAWRARESMVWQVVAIVCLSISLAAPGPVAGMSLVLAYQPIAWIYDGPMILIMGLVFRVLPFAFLVIWPAMRSLPSSLLAVAGSSGHGPASQALRVALPWTWRSSVASAGVAFALALGELAISNLVAAPSVVVASVFVWGLLHTGVESHLAGVGLVLCAVYGGVSVVCAGLVGRWGIPSTSTGPA